MPVTLWTGHELTAPHVRTLLMAELWRAEGRLHTPWLPQVVFGYGWPFFTFYAPLGYYAGAALMLLTGASAVLATKLSFYAALWLGGAGVLVLAALWLRGRGVRQPQLWGLAAAAVFSFAPYHLADVFARGALAECWGFALFPWLLAALELARRGPWAAGPAVALVYALFMLSHNITALFGTLAVGAWVLATHRWRGPWRRVLRWPLACAAGGVLGLALSAYFWYPALKLTPLVLASDVNAFWGSPDKLRAAALEVGQLFREQWGKGWSVPGPEDGFALNPGYAVLAALALGAWAALRRGGAARVRALRGRLVASLLLALAALAMTTVHFPWGALPPLLRYIQFPWRLLLFAVAFASLALLLAAPRLRAPWLALALAVLPVALAAPRTAWTAKWIRTPMNDAALWREYVEKLELGRAEYAGSIAREYLPKWVDRQYTVPVYVYDHPPPPHRLEASTETLRAGGATGFAVLGHERLGTTYLWSYAAEQPTTATVHVFDFPTWELLIDAQPAPGALGRGPTGLVTLRLPAGAHEVELRYTLSPPGRQAMAATRAAWVVWAAWLLAVALRRRRRPA